MVLGAGMTLVLPPAELLAPFLLTVAISELTPGPNMGYLALVASRWGRASGLMSVAGVTLGLSLYLVAAVAGLSGAMMKSPWILQTLRWLGVAYLVWLAFDSWPRAPSEISPSRAEAGPGRWRLFGRGILANVLNPKAALFYAVLLPSFTNPKSGDAAGQMLFLGAIHLFVATGVHIAIVLAASGVGSRGSAWRRRADHIVGRAMAVGLVALAGWLAWEARGG